MPIARDLPRSYFRANRERITDRYLQLVRRNRTQGHLLLVLALTTCIAVGGLWWHSTKTRVVPYVVEVDSATGAARALGALAEVPNPKKAVVTWALQMFLANVRTITHDQGLQTRLIYEAYEYVAGDAKSRLNEHYRQAKPYQRSRRELVRPDQVSILAITPDETNWRLEWVEVVTDNKGHELRRETWVANLTTQIIPPERSAQLLRNPFGIYIVSYDWFQLQGIDDGRR